MLIIEDDENFASLIRRFMPEMVTMVAPTAERAEWLLKSQEWSVVWTDLLLPDSQPDNTIALVRAHCRNAAVLVCSGAVDDFSHFQADHAVRKDEVCSPEAMRAAVASAIASRRSKPTYEKSVESVDALAQITKA